MQGRGSRQTDGEQANTATDGFHDDFTRAKVAAGLPKIRPSVQFPARVQFPAVVLDGAHFLSMSTNLRLS